ncbi:MAG: helix-turn-helix transcriptional regulator [Ignavibacteriae bacterium]|nr:helix-turn-helix transcriptional regulator [Ignavibacteriota bacterium]MCB9215295.1 helix-turn-helix transcriptional regulator [Ignavibacteria bacterium]
MRSKGQENEVDTYIGSLLLLRESHKSPISQETIDLIERLRMFFVYVFSDFVLRTNLSNPGGELFQHALDHVAGDIGLTWREQQILILEMEGRSYQEIADMLYVSLNTVQSHIRSVYRKAGVGKLSEFFAKYFTPRGYFTEESKKKNKE